MKRIITFLFVVLFLSNISNAQNQVLGNATSISNGSIYFGLHPYVQIFNGDNTEGHTMMGSNAQFALGFKYGIELIGKAGILYDSYKSQPSNYSPTTYNAGVLIKKHAFSSGKRYTAGFDVSVAGGVHSLHSRVGFDGVLNISFRNSGKSFFIYTGFDFDVNEEVREKNNAKERYFDFYYQVPVGIEIKPNYKWSVIIEADVPLTAGSHYVAGIGLRRHFVEREKGLGK